MKEPNTAYSCERRADRHRLFHADDAFVEFDGTDGHRWRLALLDVSCQGICFGLQDGRPVLARGAVIQDVLLRFGETEIRGSIKIAHVTEGFSSGAVCGAEFMPATEFDARRVDTLIETLSR